jgi:hypothetical protein
VRILGARGHGSDLLFPAARQETDPPKP